MIRLNLSNSILLAVILLVQAHTQAASTPQIMHSTSAYKLEKIAGGLGVPWGMAFLDAQRLVFTERAGKVKLLNLSNFAISAIDGLPAIAADGQGGLLDLAINKESGQTWIYFTYSKSTSGGLVTTLARAQLIQQRLGNWQDLLVTDSATTTGRHFGSRIAFDQQGHVFFGVGDRGVRDNAQNTLNHAGSIMRLNLDGSVPPDNPFIGSKQVRNEIWSYGHRNPQGLVFDINNNRLWEIEHGPRGGDEINLIQRGKNYGWPVVSFGKEYWGPLAVGEGTQKQGMEQPLKVYIPSIAPGSLMLYSGEAFPQWQGNLFAGALKLRHLNRISVSRSAGLVGEERLLETIGKRIRALAQSPEGWIYLSTDDGEIFRLRPNR